jgi:hypothetical protein
MMNEEPMERAEKTTMVSILYSTTASEGSFPVIDNVIAVDRYKQVHLVYVAEKLA